jgi:dienelactone hydrolase
MDDAQQRSHLMRPLLLAIAALCCVASAAIAQEPVREELRIPFSAAGPRGLEAVLLKPPGTRRFPLALLSHGAPRDGADRPAMNPSRAHAQAMEFVRRGFAALVVMRRGYGTSDGAFVERAGPCEKRDYFTAGNISSDDLRAAIDSMSGRTDVTTQGMIAVGISAGGFASVALAARPPPGLAAVISFAGGRGSRSDNDVCSPDTLVAAFASYGKTARVPMLWIYAQNDKYFGPDLARRMHAAFIGAGGRAQLIEAPAFGEDGHALYSARGIPLWTPMVDRFLREQNLGTRDLIEVSAPSLIPPPQLGENGRSNFASYLASGPHKAFAVSPRGAFAHRAGRRSEQEARDDALAACAKYAKDCAIYAIDDKLAGAATAAGPR